MQARPMILMEQHFNMSRIGPISVLSITMALFSLLVLPFSIFHFSLFQKFVIAFPDMFESLSLPDMSV